MNGHPSLQADNPDLDAFEDALRDMACDMLNKGHPVDRVTEAFSEVCIMLDLHAMCQRAEVEAAMSVKH